MRRHTLVYRAPPASAGALDATRRLQTLDTLRAVAALAVVLRHILALLAPEAPLLAYVDLGDVGVIVFFLCSGFIIPSSLEAQASLRTFWVRRVFRLYPLYWFTLGLALVWHLLGSGADVSRGPFSNGPALAAALATQPIATVLANAGMIQAFVGVPHLLGVAWTLSYELLFYVVISALYALRLHQRIVPVTLVCVVGALVAQLLVPAVWGLPAPRGMLSYLGLMFLGAALARQQAGALSRQAATWVTGAVLLMFVLTSIGDTLTIGGAWLPRVTAGLIAFGVFALLIRLPERPALAVPAAVGKISYSLYLLHMFVLSGVPVTGAPLLTAVVWLLLSLIVASLSFHLIEQPCIALGRRLSVGSSQ